MATKPTKRRRVSRPVKRVKPTGLLAWGASRTAVAFRLHASIVEGLNDAAAVLGMTRNKLVEAVLYEYVMGEKPPAEAYAKEAVDERQYDLFG